MGPIEAVQTVFLKYAKFRGRAPRSEYWWFMLFYAAVGGAAFVADAQKLFASLSAETFSFDTRIAAYWTPWVMLLFFLPYHAVSVRRLHDVGLSGFWMLGLIYGPAFAYPFVMVGAVANQLSSGSLDGATNMMIGYQVVAALFSLAFFVLMLWPTQRADNRHGPGPYEHHAVGGGNFMAAGNAANAGSAKAAAKATHNPWAAMIHLEKSNRPLTEDEVAAHREEIRSLYRQKILGEADETRGDQPPA